MSDRSRPAPARWQRLDALEGDDIRGVARQIAAFAQPAVFGLDQRDQRAARRHRRGRRYARQSAAQTARRWRGRRACRRHRPLCGHADGTGATVIGAAGASRLCSRQQPAGGQRFRQRHRQGEAPGDAENGEAFRQAGARATQSLRNPGERQPGVVERLPERLLPRAILCLVYGLRIGEVGENLRRRSATIWLSSPGTISY